MPKDLAIVCSSGSLESLVAAGLAAQKYRLVLVHAVMNSRENRRLRQAYELQVQHFKPLREHTIDLTALESVDVRRAGDHRPGAETATRLVELLPLLSIATRYAAHYQASAVVMGLRAGPRGHDLARATEFGQVMSELIQMPCGMLDCELQLPVVDLEPWQMADLAVQLQLPLDKSWSCDEDLAQPCGTCAGCRQREAAFIRAGRADVEKREVGRVGTRG
jgi:7-cyano-7-deazaguanine synthase in queuosine biosynthesis